MQEDALKVERASVPYSYRSCMAEGREQHQTRKPSAIIYSPAAKPTFGIPKYSPNALQCCSECRCGVSRTPEPSTQSALPVKEAARAPQTRGSLQRQLTLTNNIERPLRLRGRASGRAHRERSDPAEPGGHRGHTGARTPSEPPRPAPPLPGTAAPPTAPLIGRCRSPGRARSAVIGCEPPDGRVQQAGRAGALRRSGVRARGGVAAAFPRKRCPVTAPLTPPSASAAAAEASPAARQGTAAAAAARPRNGKRCGGRAGAASEEEPPPPPHTQLTRGQPRARRRRLAPPPPFMAAPHPPPSRPFPSRPRPWSGPPGEQQRRREEEEEEESHGFKSSSSKRCNKRLCFESWQRQIHEQRLVQTGEYRAAPL
ncbi:uncharacterized protein [Taeniopygia guttata]|uniref:uncharacterized protein n=1 Tax=Taeniopygia guttata TaxID=59729 RepID=UPI003BB85460